MPGYLTSFHVGPYLEPYTIPLFRIPSLYVQDIRHEIGYPKVRCLGMTYIVSFACSRAFKNSKAKSFSRHGKGFRVEG